MYDQETTKYRIHLHVQAEGVVERSDVVGAIFGQIEGLLGADLELRELQRQGRIGRIDVKIQSKKGKSFGDVMIATSLDRAETAILAASMETINRIGPCSAVLSVENIEDIRVTKRTQIIERAKALLLEFEEPGIDPESIIEAVRESQRIEKLEMIGPDNVPAGPNVLNSDAIIVVEGRADVINLLKAGIKNSVAVEGTSVPETIIDICHKKTATAFLDGDRGGDLILKELLEVTDIDFVAFPPRGESVEDLSRKEIIKALRNKVPIEYVLEDRVAEYYASRQILEDVEKTASDQDSIPMPRTAGQPIEESRSEPAHEEEKEEGGKEESPVDETIRLSVHIQEIKDRKMLRLLGQDGSIISDISVSEMDDAISRNSSNITGVVIDQDIDQHTLDQLSLLGISYLAAPSFEGIVRQPARLRLIPFR